MTILQAVFLLGGGLAAGFINVLAGGGSAITIPIMTEIVGVNVANGTNRIAILLANASALTTFQQGGAVPWDRVKRLIAPTVTGAAFGAWVATQISADVMKNIFAVVLVLVAASVMLRPSRWVEGHEHELSEPWRSLAFFGIGFYGGSVQAGVGFLLLIGLVLGSGMDLVRGNAAKVVLILAYTPVALLLFATAAQVDVRVGLVLSIGQMTGAWIGARFAMLKGAAWIRWILVVAAIVAAVRFLLT
ncbi:MAG: sulfite exporter TauE/SafE family protein [Acidimicrobiia bacterium]|nr:sulfite exporter TauE/SafE family protein [Acidimicrobiia bacterium]